MSAPQDPSAVESPCNDICRLDTQQVCVGCGRTLQEIADWGNASAERRRAIVAAARLRQASRPALQ